MRNFDLTPLFRTSVGFDRLQRSLDAASRYDAVNTYPPYDIESFGDDDYRISLAVAGFTQDDLEITVKENSLLIETVGQTNAQKETSTYLHQGIAKRAFTRRFELADHVHVADARLDKGLLIIDLKRKIPEALKPRKVSISTASDTQIVDNQTAA